jgi:hypothetical protein
MCGFVEIHNVPFHPHQLDRGYARAGNNLSQKERGAVANYVLVYKGGGGMAPTPAEQEKIMADWGQWFGGLGQALVDGGNPFSGQATSIASDGSSKDGAGSGLTGYSILKADDLAAATTLAKGCPVLKSGGTIEVYETLAVM